MNRFLSVEAPIDIDAGEMNSEVFKKHGGEEEDDAVSTDRVYSTQKVV